MRFALLLPLTLALVSVSASETLDLANGHSPDGKYSVRVRALEGSEEIPQLEIINESTKAVVGATHSGGYARYPAVADDISTSVLWSPDSKHLALMTRGTKRSRELRLYQVTAAGIKEIILPSPTDKAFELLKATSSYRVVLQRPKKWIDSSTLVVLASGAVENTSGDKIPIYYEVDVTFDIQKQKITNGKVLIKKAYEG